MPDSEEAQVQLDPTPTAEEEELFENPDEVGKRLKNKELSQDIDTKREYVQSAKSLSETWVGFSIVISICQFVKPAGLHLETAEFVAVVATSLGAVIALWAIVGRGLFKTRE